MLLSRRVLGLVSTLWPAQFPLLQVSWITLVNQSPPLPTTVHTHTHWSHTASETPSTQHHLKQVLLTDLTGAAAVIQESKQHFLQRAAAKRVLPSLLLQLLLCVIHANVS